MAPRKQRITRAAVTSSGKENSTPTDSGSRGKGRTSIRRARRMPTRFSPVASTTPRSGSRSSAHLFRQRIPTALSLERRRECFAERASSAADLCADDPAVISGTLPSLEDLSAGKCGDAVDCDGFLTIDLQEVLAPDWVCDDSLSSALLMTRMRCALFRLKAIPNFAEAKSPPGLFGNSADSDAKSDDGIKSKRGKGKTPDTVGSTRKTRRNSRGQSDAVPPVDCDRASAESELHGMLRDLATSIAVERFIDHKSNAVRLMTACILAELLRISAPDPPLSMEKLSPVASLFIDQFVLLSASKDLLTSYRMALLEQTAATKIFVVFCDDEDVVCDLFACFYALAAGDQSRKLLTVLSQILSTVLEEADVLSQSVLDAALAPLIPSQKYASNSVLLAERVVSLSCNSLQVPLCNFFNTVLRSSKVRDASLPSGKSNKRGSYLRSRGSPEDSEDESIDGADLFGQQADVGGTPAFELSSGALHRANASALVDNVQDLLIRINSVASDILIYVIPNFERDLRSSDVTCRLRCVRLLSSLFSASQDMVLTYPSLLADFISRVKDSDEAVRIHVCHALGRLVVSSPQLRDNLVASLRERLLDKEEKVRLAAIEAVMSASGHVDHATLVAVSDRVKDRKIGVRQAALLCLVNAYRSGLVVSRSAENKPDSVSQAGSVEHDSALRSSGDLNVSETRRHSSGRSRGSDDELSCAKVVHPNSWIPSTLIQAYLVLYNIKDHDTAAQIERALFFDLYRPRGVVSTESACTGSLCQMLCSLDDTAFESFKSIATQRLRLRRAVRRLALHRVETRKVRQVRETEPPPSARPRDPGSSSYHATFSKRIRSNSNPSPHLEGEPGGTGTDEPSLDVLVSELSACLPDIRFGADTGSSLSAEFAALVDLHIFKKTLIAIDENSAIGDAELAVDDVISRVGSKTVLAEFLRDVVFSKCCPRLLSSAHIQSFLTACSPSSSSRTELTPQGVAEADVFRLPQVADQTLASLDCLSRGFSKYLEFAAHASPEAFQRSNAVSLAALIIGDEPSALRSNGNERGQSESPPVRRSSPRSPGNEDLRHALASLMRPSCLKVLYFLGAAPFAGHVADICRKCRYLAVASNESPELLCQQSKWAVRTLILLAKSPHGRSSELSLLTASLTACLDSFDGNAETIVAPLTALCQLAKFAGDTFQPVALSSFDFSRALLMGAMNARIREHINSRFLKVKAGGPVPVSSRNASGVTARRRSETGSSLASDDGSGDVSGVSGSRFGQGGEQVSPEMIYFAQMAKFLGEAVRRASKLFASAIGHLESAEEEVSTVLENLVSVMTVKNGDVFGFNDGDGTIGSDGLWSNGGWPGSADILADLCGLSRLAASIGVLYVARNPRLFRSIRPAQFLAVVLCAQDEHPDIRLAFARKIVRYVIRKRLQFRWTVALCLMGIDPDSDNLSEVKQLFSSVIRHRRRALAAARQARPDRAQSLLDLSPEASLPELVWVIANHPDAETDESDGYPDSERYLEFYFDRLLEAHEYASIVNRYLVNLSVARDAQDGAKGSSQSGDSSRRISAIARLATAILEKKRSGRKWNMVDYAGDAKLPSDLFSVRSASVLSSGIQGNAMLNVAKDYDEDVAQLQRSVESRRRFGSRGMVGSPSSSHVGRGAPVASRDKRANPTSQAASSKPTDVARASKRRGVVSAGSEERPSSAVAPEAVSAVKRRSSSRLREDPDPAPSPKKLRSVSRVTRRQTRQGK